MAEKKNRKFLFSVIGALFLLFILSYFLLPSFFSKKYEISSSSPTSVVEGITLLATQPAASITPSPIPLVVTHIKTPPRVKALYMTSWVAGTPSIRKHIIDLVDTTEANAIVIDIKDYTGKIAFKVSDPFLQEIGSSENRIPNIKELISALHEKNIYVIGRVAVFQDPYLVGLRPELAVKRESDGGVWKDRKGISWLDAGSKEAWDYHIAIAKESYNVGFDEINFDYIRFPSDGNMSDILYPFSEGKEKPQVLKEFFSYLNKKLKSSSGESMVISADLFGLTTSAQDDLGIGQVLENALPYFDYIAPMVYPSHYPTGFNGYKNPAEHPYEVIKFAMDSAVARAENASTTPLKIRPWLQDFDLGADYTADMVRAQIQATYDAGLTSWMMWDPSNKYTRGAFLPH